MKIVRATILSAYLAAAVVASPLTAVDMASADELSVAQAVANVDPSSIAEPVVYDGDGGADSITKPCKRCK